MKITGDVRSSSIVGKKALSCHQSMIVQNATEEFRAAVDSRMIVHTNGRASMTGIKDQSSETDAIMISGLVRCMIDWGAESAHMRGLGEKSAPMSTKDRAAWKSLPKEGFPMKTLCAES